MGPRGPGWANMGQHGSNIRKTLTHEVKGGEIQSSRAPTLGPPGSFFFASEGLESRAPTRTGLRSCRGYIKVRGIPLMEMEKKLPDGARDPWYLSGP